MKNLFLFSIVVLANAGLAVAQDNATAPEARVVTIGTVGKIDSKAKSIKLILATSVTVKPPAEDPKTKSQGGSGGRGGHGGGGGGKTEGGTSGGGSARGRLGSPTLRTYTVMISPMTVLKEGDKQIQFADLMEGDALEVMSANTNSKLDAIEVKRIPRDSPSSR